MLIPQVTDETRLEECATPTAKAYELLAVVIELSKQHELQEGQFPRDFWISEREHRKQLQALRDGRDQCELLGTRAVFAGIDEVSV